MKQLEIGDLVTNRLFVDVPQPHIGVLVDRVVEWIGDELHEGEKWFVSWDTGEVSPWAIRNLEALNDPPE
jgi:hypothetical protein